MVRAVAAGLAGHGIDVRSVGFGVAGRREPYNHLNKGLQSAWQWPCKLLTRALQGIGRRVAGRGMPQWCLEGNACRAAEREHAPATLESARRSSLFELQCRMCCCEHAAC